MLRLARPTLRLVVGSALVAAFTGFELRNTGTFAALAGAWFVFAICVFTLGIWGKLRLEQNGRRLHARRSRRSKRTQ